jgi:hypothetical protein
MFLRKPLDLLRVPCIIGLDDGRERRAFQGKGTTVEVKGMSGSQVCCLTSEVAGGKRVAPASNLSDHGVQGSGATRLTYRSHRVTLANCIDVVMMWTPGTTPKGD